MTAAVQLVLADVIVMFEGIFDITGALSSSKLIVCRQEADNDGLLGSVAVQVL